MNIEKMDHDSCIALVQDNRIGRLACCKDGRPYVVPVHYVCSAGVIFSFTMPGQKLDFMRHNPQVCLEVEHIERSDKWKCVLVEGVFREFTFEADQQEAWKVLQQHNDWWEVGGQLVDKEKHDPDRKPVFFSVSMGTVTGREALELH